MIKENVLKEIFVCKYIDYGNKTHTIELEGLNTYNEAMTILKQILKKERRLYLEDSIDIEKRLFIGEKR